MRYKPINIINIGGITNITKILNNDQKNEKNIFAFDIGPGNCLIDSWIKKNLQKKFDHNGEVAKSGKIDELILNQAIDNFGEGIIFAPSYAMFGGEGDWMTSSFLKK